MKAPSISILLLLASLTTRVYGFGDSRQSSSSTSSSSSTPSFFVTPEEVNKIWLGLLFVECITSSALHSVSMVFFSDEADEEIATAAGEPARAVLMNAVGEIPSMRTRGIGRFGFNVGPISAIFQTRGASVREIARAAWIDLLAQHFQFKHAIRRHFDNEGDRIDAPELLQTLPLILAIDLERFKLTVRPVRIYLCRVFAQMFFRATLGNPRALGKLTDCERDGLEYFNQEAHAADERALQRWLVPRIPLGVSIMAPPTWLIVLGYAVTVVNFQSSLEELAEVALAQLRFAQWRSQARKASKGDEEKRPPPEN